MLKWLRHKIWLLMLTFPKLLPNGRLFWKTLIKYDKSGRLTLRGSAQLSFISWTVDPIGLHFYTKYTNYASFFRKVVTNLAVPPVQPEKKNFLKKWFLTHSCQRLYIIHIKLASHAKKSDPDYKNWQRYAHFYQIIPFRGWDTKSTLFQPILYISTIGQRSAP